MSDNLDELLKCTYGLLDYLAGPKTHQEYSECGLEALPTDALQELALACVQRNSELYSKCMHVIGAFYNAQLMDEADLFALAATYQSVEERAVALEQVQSILERRSERTVPNE